MKKASASSLKQLVMRIHTPPLFTLAIFFLSTTIFFVSMSQPVIPVKKDIKAGILSIAYYIESANNSVNSINSLLKKDNYRNKITSLNNPTNNELGFSLKGEITNALKPILDKTRKTDTRKFKDVIENFLTNPEENGISSVKKYLPALGIFSTILSLVGNLVIVERTITAEDLAIFVNKIQQYFSQYEKLNAINQQFGEDIQVLLERSEEIKSDLKEFLIDCISTMNKNAGRSSLRELSVEVLIQKYYDPQKLQSWIDTSQIAGEVLLFPPDAPTSVKLLTSGIKKLQKEFEALYKSNYTQLKELMASLKTTLPNLDQKQLEKTNAEIDKLYSESRQADMINLNITQVDERMSTACKVINEGR